MKRPYRTVFIAGRLILGGAEQQLYYLLSGLDRARIDPVVITLGSTQEEYWEEPIRNLNVPLWRLQRNTGRFERTIRIARLLRQLQPHIVHGWVFYTNPYAAVGGALAHVPVRFGSMRESYGGLPNNAFLRQIGCRGLDVLVTNAAQTAGEVQKNKVRVQVKVVPNGNPI